MEVAGQEGGLLRATGQKGSPGAETSVRLRDQQPPATGWMSCPFFYWVICLLSVRSSLYTFWG